MINKKPWLPKLLFVSDDGGLNSGVKMYGLIEWKRFFTIALLKFNKGSREAYHSHAFHAITWFLWGGVYELQVQGAYRYYGPSLYPKVTLRSNTHKVEALKTTWALTFRGPWKDTWIEKHNNKQDTVVLTHKRKIVNV